MPIVFSVAHFFNPKLRHEFGEYCLRRAIEARWRDVQEMTNGKIGSACVSARQVRLSVLDGLSHGAARRDIPLPNDNKEGPRNLVKFVIPRPQRTTSNRQRLVSKGAVDSNQCEADILDLSVSYVRGSRGGIKR